MACSAPSRPAEAAVSPAQRKQYNSPIGLYSEETLREMAALQAGGYVESSRRRRSRKSLRGGANRT